MSTNAVNLQFKTVLITVLALAAIILLIAVSYPIFQTSRIRYSLTNSASWWIAPSLIAARENFYADEGVTVEGSNWWTGKRALRALLDHQSDMSFTAGPPIMTASHNGESIVILGQTMSSRSIVHLLVNRDHVHDWYDHPIALPLGTISEFFLIAHLRKLGKIDLYKTGKLQLIDRPQFEANFMLLVQGLAQSVVMFEPFPALIRQTEKNAKKYTTISDADIYKVNCYIVTTPKQWQENRTGILRALAAIRRAGNLITADPAAGWEKVRPLLSYGYNVDLWGQREWNKVDFNLVTDKKTIQENLELDSNLGIEVGLYKKPPDYDALLSVVDDVDAYLRKRGL